MREAQKELALQMSPELVRSMVRLLELGLAVEAFGALAAALEELAKSRVPGRVSLHVDSPPGGGPARMLMQPAGEARPAAFPCRGRR